MGSLRELKILEGIVVIDTGVGFVVKGQNQHVSMRQYEQIFVDRLIIASRPGFALPNIGKARKLLQMALSGIDIHTRDYFTITTNSYGQFLIEIPNRSKNIKAMTLFLDMLDDLMVLEGK